MAITPNLALELTDEQLLVIAAVTETVDQYLIDNFVDGRTTIVRQALIYDLFKFESKVLKAFIKNYTDVGWVVTKYENVKQGAWLNFSRSNEAAINAQKDIYFGDSEIIDTVGDLIQLESRKATGPINEPVIADGYSYVWVVIPSSIAATILLNNIPQTIITQTLTIGSDTFVVHRSTAYGLGLVNVSIII